MSEQLDILQVEGINSKGFGTIPKLVMQDKRLSIQAKAIYAYFCSFAGIGATAFPRQTKVVSDLGIGKNSYYKHFNQLKECGYIQVNQEKDRTGKFMRNLYTLTQSAPIPQNGESVNFSQPFPYLWDTVKRDTVKGETYISNKKNSSKINNFNNNTLSCDRQGTNSQSNESLKAVSDGGPEIPANPSMALNDSFESFWRAYPRKESKGAAERAWRKINPSAKLLAAMLPVTAAAKQSEQWNRDNGRWIPAPAKWLKNKCWQDELSQAKAGTGGLSYDINELEIMVASDALF